jgi:integrase
MTMGVSKYTSRGVTFWKVDETILLHDGREQRLRLRKVPTKEQAQALVAKARAAAFEGRYFDKVKPCTLSVRQAWELYEPISRRDNDAWRTERGRAEHAVRLLGERRVVQLGQEDIDLYRNQRLKEKTRRGQTPAPATLDREVELLKRVINYAVKCNKVPANPIAKVALLRRPNVRSRVITEEQFQRLDRVLEIEPKDSDFRMKMKLTFRGIMLMAYDQGMRLREVLNLERSQLHLKEGFVELRPQDTKTEEGRKVFLTRRTMDAIRALPTDIASECVFPNPKTGKPFREVRKTWYAVRNAAGLPPDTWFHDTRRSYATNSRRRGIAERVIMAQTGHKTRAVFDRYNIVDESDQRKAVEQYEAALRQESVKVADQARSRNDEGPQFPEGLRVLPQ